MRRGPLALAVSLAGQVLVATPEKKNPHPSLRKREELRHPQVQRRAKGAATHHRIIQPTKAWPTRPIFVNF
jgi:hypothetical protein